MKTLVLGGIRSGKSAIAEDAVRRAAGTAPVTYVATGPQADDGDWAARVEAHRSRRPASWATVETTDLPGALAALTGPAIVDCLGTWLTARLDELGVWDAQRAHWEPRVGRLVDTLADAVRACPHDVVFVSNEVGLSLVPDNRAGRIFADWLGLTNQRIADACDTVLLVVAGQVLTVKQP